MILGAKLKPTPVVASVETLISRTTVGAKALEETQLT